jgi:hypothetical protein
MQKISLYFPENREIEGGDEFADDCLHPRNFYGKTRED